MELKNAVAVCLISLFSATLVVLIARALDLQAASRLEPQLAKIVEELQALRKSGGVAAPSNAAALPATAQDKAPGDCLMVYYFHSNARCPTCRAIESQSYQTVQADFAPQLEKGEVVWKILNYEDRANGPLADKFAVQVPVVVLARVRGGQIEQWKRLDQVWPLVGDQPAFAQYVRDEISQMLAAAEQPPAAAPKSQNPDIPLPIDKAQNPLAPLPPDIPVPQ